MALFIKWRCNQEGIILNLYWTCFCDFNPYLAAFVIISIHKGLHQGEYLTPPTCEGLWYSWILCVANVYWGMARNSHLRRLESLTDVTSLLIWWDGWMASPMQWTWTWANFGRWWRTERPGMLQAMGSQRVGHDRANEKQQQIST